jgi:predicted RNase H-like HicB family nuclease
VKIGVEMTTNALTYLAVFERIEGEENWSVLFPDLPEIAATAETEGAAFSVAADALASAAEAYAEDGRALPEPRPFEQVLDALQPPEGRRVVAAVPVEPPGRPVRINVTVDPNLLRRVDAAATRLGMSRSRFLAQGARLLVEQSSD